MPNLVRLQVSSAGNGSQLPSYLEEKPVAYCPSQYTTYTMLQGVFNSFHHFSNVPFTAWIEHDQWCISSPKWTASNLPCLPRIADDAMIFSIITAITIIFSNDYCYYYYFWNSVLPAKTGFLAFLNVKLDSIFSSSLEKNSWFWSGIDKDQVSLALSIFDSSWKQKKSSWLEEGN